jgi:hypothetical protein
MQELLNKIVTETGVTNEQATKMLDVVKNFVTEKFPMLGGAVESMLGAGKKEDDFMQ